MEGKEIPAVGDFVAVQHRRRGASLAYISSIQHELAMVRYRPESRYTGAFEVSVASFKQETGTAVKWVIDHEFPENA